LSVWLNRAKRSLVERKKGKESKLKRKELPLSAIDAVRYTET